MKRQRAAVLETLITLAVVLLVISLVFSQVKFLYGGIALLIIALFCTSLAARLAGWWLTFAELLATINTRVLLTILFYLLLTPLAVLYRQFNRNPLRLKAEKALPSYYIEHNHYYNGSDLEKLW